MNEAQDILMQIMREQGELPDPGIQLDENAPESAEIRPDPPADAPDEDYIKNLLKEEMLNKGEIEEPVSISDYAKAFARGANKLIMSPVTGVEELGAKAANVVRPLIGKEPLPETSPQYTPRTKQLEQTFYPKDYPETRGTRMAERAGEFVPETAAFVGGMGALRGPSLVVEATGPISRMAQQLVKASTEPYIGNLPTITRDVLAGSAGAGAGMQYAKEATEGSPWQPTAEMLGGVIGGGAVTAPYDAAKSLTKGYWNYISPVNWANKLVIQPVIGRELLPSSWYEGSGVIPSALRSAKESYLAQQTEKALPMAAQQFKSLQTPENTASVQAANELRKEMPGFNPTLAETTGAPSLLATQAATENKAAGELLNELVRRKQQSGEAIKAYAESNAPGTVGDNTVSAPLQRRFEELQSGLGSRLQGVNEAELRAAEQIPETPRAATGEALRGRLEEMRAAKQQEMSQYADELGLNTAGKLNVPVQGLKTAVQSAMPSKLATDVSRVMNKIQGLPEGEALNFNDAKYLMESLGEDARTLAAQGRNNDARIVGKARSAIDNYLQDEWAPALGIGEKYANFRKRYLDEYITPFEKGYTKGVKATGPDTEYRTDVENVVGTYFSPGKVTAARDFKRTFGDDPEANDALKAYVLDDINKKVIKDGTFDLKAFDKWHKAHKDVLDEFPEIRDRISDTKGMVEDLSNRRLTLEKRKQNIQDSDLYKALGNDDTVIDKMLADNNLLNRTVSKMTEGEKQALARRVWDKASVLSDKDPAKMREFMDANEVPLKTILGDSHLKALRNIQQAVEMHSRTKVPTGQKEAADAFSKMSETFGSSPQQLLSRAFAVQSGRTGWKYTLGDLLIRKGVKANQQAAEEMMNKAIYDPEFAKYLSEYVNTKLPKPAQTKKFKGYLYTSGINALMGDEKSQ